MCGIVAIAGKAPVAERLLAGLKRLEYRGYDSAGIAVIGATGAAERRRAPGKLAALEAVLAADPIDGETGLAHTRWATHGAPTETNAHPHRAGRVSVVHNGIIENFAALRAELEAAGRVFETETDSETIAHLIDAELESGRDPEAAVAAVLSRLDGAYAIAVVFADRPGLVIGARHGSPLIAGIGEGETFLGSDSFALAPFTNKVIYLEEGDRVVARPDGVTVYDRANRPANRPVALSQTAAALAEKGAYRHFMLKEIHEQPTAIAHTLSAYLDPVAGRATPPEGLDLAGAARLAIVACGTASYAGEVAKYWFEGLAGLPTDVDIASEFRYRQPALTPGSLAIAISQSGETADTRAALELCREEGLATAALVNVRESSIARLADSFLPTLAGPEIGVASTKAFTSQLAALAALAIAAASARGRIDAAEEARLVRTLFETPRLVQSAIAKMEAKVARLATELARARDVLYLGRGALFPLALEGALKLKEISYIHAEGYAAGELKHGPIALIDEHTPTVALAPSGPHFEK
ncbi:MAG: glutamine--fructose-6-phosphate transaminase (isomerizing), partial [Caulobacterales bacterium]|nr:glutamine--fructose-6-phosphate transaminase (isomerizing) [Caulobacterales bacterium]